MKEDRILHSLFKSYSRNASKKELRKFLKKASFHKESETELHHTDS